MDKMKFGGQVMSEATPRPWEMTDCIAANCTEGLGHYEIFSRHGNHAWIAKVQMELSEPESGEANARLIVQAVNAFEPMLEALKLAQVEIGASGNWMANDFGWKKACTAIAAAIALAEGQAMTEADNG